MVAGTATGIIFSLVTRQRFLSQQRWSLMNSRIARCSASLAILFFLLSAIPVQAVGVYYAEVGFADSVNRQDADPTVASGSNTTLISLPSPGGTRDPRGIAVDNVNGKIYYGDGLSIASMNFDGSSPATLIPLLVTPGDIEVDPVNGKIYYSTLFDGPGNGIFSANLDGTGIATIHTNASLALAMAPATITVNNVFNLSIDTSAGLLYWTADDGGAAGNMGLNVSTTGGGGASQLFVGSGSSPSINRMDIDFDAANVYYTVGGGIDEVRRSTLTGTGVTTLVSGVGRPDPIALDLEHDEMFFFVGGRIHQRELDGTAITSKLILGGGVFSASDMQVVGDTISTPGDFDFDGDVDGRDFLIWQRGDSPDPLSASDLALWQDHYGSGPLVASATVPEPSSALLLLLGASLAMSYGRQRC
jgi:hypothetical protein